MTEGRMEEAKKVVKMYEENEELFRAEEMIKDNKITFFVEDKKYRVRMLNLAERNELDNLRRKKFGQLLQDKDIMMEKDLIKQYQERGINISEMDERIQKLTAEEVATQLKLGEAISKNDGESVLNTYKETIESLQHEKRAILAEKTLLLEFSLENQLLSYVAQIFTYLSLEVFEDNSWKRKFESIAEFEKTTDDKLINTAAQYSILLQSL